jgi:hypothetical protein
VCSRAGSSALPRRPNVPRMSRRGRPATAALSAESAC